MDIEPTSSSKEPFNFLLSYDKLFFKQKTKKSFWSSFFIPIELDFDIFDNKKNVLFKVTEKNQNKCKMFCLGNKRSLKITITNSTGEKEFLKIKKSYNCMNQGLIGGTCSSFEVCWGDFEIYYGKDTEMNGTLLGRIREDFSCCVPTFNILDSNDDEQFRIMGEYCNWCKQYHYNLGIYKWDDKIGFQDFEEIGSIFKEISTLKECISELDSYTLTFPNDTNPQQRAMFLAATVFVDLILFSKSGSDSHIKNALVV